MSTGKSSTELPVGLLLRVVALLLATLVLLSAVATVPLVESTAGEDGTNESFESFEIEFAAAQPDQPSDVHVRWNLSEDADDVDLVRVAIQNESGESINIYRQEGPDVPNPFTVSDGGQNSPDTDIHVQDLSAVELALKIPPGHCDRVDEIQVYADGNDPDSLAEPDIERPVNCTVTQSGEFDVTITDYDQDVNPGENVSVTAEIKNTGTAADTQDVRFLVDDTEHDQANLTLAANESESLQFSSETNRSDVGELEVAVESDDDRENRTVTVLEQPTFAVTIDEYDHEVVPGETVNVTATIENTADVEQTQDIRFLVDDTEHDRVNLTLAGNESETLQFSSETTQSTVGELDIAVESDDDRENRTVTVLKPPYFAVTITETPDEVVAGKPINVTVQVDNTGEQVGTQNITLTDVDGEIVEVHDSLSLASGESSNVTLQWVTDGTDTGRGNVSVASENDSDTAPVNITEPVVESITVTLGATVITVSEETSITVAATFTDDTVQTVTENATLTANDTDVAAITDDRTALGQSEGSVTIEAAFRNVTDDERLTVEAASEDSSSSESSSSSSSSGSSAPDETDSDDDGSEESAPESDDSPDDDSNTVTPGESADSSDPSTDSADAGADGGDDVNGEPDDDTTTIAFLPLLALFLVPVVLRALYNRRL